MTRLLALKASALEHSHRLVSSMSSCDWPGLSSIRASFIT